MVNSGVMRYRVLGITNSDKYVILSSTPCHISGVVVEFYIDIRVVLDKKGLST